MSLHHERDDLYRVEVLGRLLVSEFASCQRELAGELRRAGRPVRLLCLLRDFEGWEPDDDWRDLGFYVAHGDAIERLAIVGDERWRDESLMFASADLRKGPVEFFVTDDVARARAWLAA